LKVLAKTHAENAASNLVGITGCLVWKAKFKWSFGDHAVLLDEQGALVMEIETPAPFSSKPQIVTWDGFTGTFEWEAEKSLWMNLLPWVRRIDTHLVLRS
jgi:hypothetical protein